MDDGRDAGSIGWPKRSEGRGPCYLQPPRPMGMLGEKGGNNETKFFLLAFLSLAGAHVHAGEYGFV